MAIRDVEPFVRVAEAGSFRRASERLGVTPAAVSKAVAKLEEDLGVRLLERTSRRVSLTPEGRTYLEHARAALDHLDAGRDLVAQAQRVVQGTVRVSLPYLLGRSVISALPRLAARHPRLSFDVRLTDRLVDLAADDVDVALRIGELPDHADLVARPLRRPHWATVASPAYLGRRGTPQEPRDLLEHACCVFVSPSGAEVPFRFAGRDPIEVPATLRVDQGELLVEAAIAGVGVSQAFDWMVAPHLTAGRLVEVLSHRAAEGPPLNAVVLPQRRRTPRVRALLDFLEETLA